MSKLKHPLLSLGAKGSLGEVLTFQRSHHVDLVRLKPFPRYRYTLPQAYQRWLYEDYAYLWTQQSEATRQQYASAGVRWHLTGFQYWMKVYLATLPDIMAWWKLDNMAGATTPDSSHSGYNATIFGVSPDTGVIDGCGNFDGLNNYLSVATTPLLDFLGDFSVELFVEPHEFKTQMLVCRGLYANDGWAVFLGATGYISLGTYFPADQDATRTGPNAYTIDEWQHLVFNLSGLKGHLWRNATELALAIDNNHDQRTSSTRTCYIGRYDTPSLYCHGLIDNIIIRNRVLDESEIIRHSERGYSA